MASDDDPDPQATLKSVQDTFTTVIPLLGEDEFGAPIMQIVTNEGVVVAMEGYEDLSGLENNEQFQDLIAQF